MVAKVFLFLSGIYTLAITWLSLVQLGKISIGEFNPTDKMLHAGAYLLLMVLWKLYFVFKREDFTSYRSDLIKIATVCLLYGMLMEVFQGVLTSYRDPDWWDIIANSAGVLLAVVFFLIFFSFLRKIKQRIG